VDQMRLDRLISGDIGLLAFNNICFGH